MEIVQSHVCLNQYVKVTKREIKENPETQLRAFTSNFLINPTNHNILFFIVMLFSVHSLTSIPDFEV